MLIDVRSIERARWIIEFIDHKVPRRIAEITHGAIYNKLTTAQKDNSDNIRNLDYDIIFSHNNITEIHPGELEDYSKEVADTYENKEDRIQAMLEKSESDSKKPMPLVEKLPVYFYEEGIESFSVRYQLRQSIAIKHVFRL